MPSTYTLNNGIELISTGEQSGTWGDTTNTNLSLLDTALDGQVTVTLPSAGTSGSPNTLAITDGAASDGRNRMVTFADGGDLGATAYVQLTPNDSEKIIYVRNSLSGSRSIILFQGTYNASNDYELPAGTTAVVYFDGAGSGAVAANVFNNAYFDSLRLGSISVTEIIDDDTMATAAATNIATSESIKAYVDSQVTAQDLDFGGDSGTGAVDLDSQTFTIAGTSNEIETSASGQTLTIGLPDDVTISGDLTVDTDTLYVDSTNNRVGIGTSSPKRNLHIHTPSAGAAKIQITNSATGSGSDGDGFQLGIGGTGQANIEQRENQPLTFSTNNTERMRIDSSGNVGIGTSSPSAKLNIEADASVALRVENITNNSYVNSNFVDDAGSGLTITSYGSAYASGSLLNVGAGGVAFRSTTDMAITAATGKTLRFGTADTERMRIDASGNVGIGTSSPSSFFGDSYLVVGDGTGTPTSTIYGSSTGTSYMLFADGTTGSAAYSGGLEYNHASDYLGFFANGGERMRIDSSGNVGIGTSSGGSGPQDNLHISSSLPTIRLEDSDVSGGAGYSLIHTSSNGNIEFKADPDNVRSSTDIRFAVDGSEAMRIDSSGNVGIGTTSPYSSNGTNLEVYDADTIARLVLHTGTGKRWSVGSVASDSRLSFYDIDTSSEAMAIDTLGNVGIGTSSPDVNLHIKGNDGLKIEDDGTTNFFRIQTSNSGDAVFYTGSGGTPTERMRIYSSGNVGIGTSSPSAPLDVAGNNASGPIAEFRAVNASNEGSILIDSPSNSDLRPSYVRLARGGELEWTIGGVYGDTSRGVHFYDFGSSSTRMIIQSGGNVGIGTTSPSALLQVESSDGVAGGAIMYTASGVASGYMSADAAGLCLATDTAGITFRTGVTGADPTDTGSERMRIVSSGFVGIGTTSPSTRLTVSHNSNNIFAVERTGVGSGSGQFGLNIESNSQTTMSYDDGSSFVIGTASNPSTHVGFTSRMHIDSSGNVGIGTTSPSERLDVQTTAGRFKVKALGGSSVQLESDSAVKLKAAANDVILDGASNIIFDIADAEKMRIDSSGNLLVGTTLTSEVDESGTRIVAGDAGFIQHSRTSTTDTLPNIDLARGNDGKAIRFIRNDGSNREVGDIVLNTSSTSYNTSSDHRLKENVVELTGATTRLKQLEPKRFNFIADADTTVDGFLAHEVQAVVPEAIHGTHNEVDADGNPVYQGIDQSKLVPLLVATIKELEARITALENA